MNASQLETRPLFASPVATRSLQKAEGLNQELAQLILQREAEPYRNPNPTHIPQREVFESNFDMFR